MMIRMELYSENRITQVNDNIKLEMAAISQIAVVFQVCMATYPLFPLSPLLPPLFPLLVLSLLSSS